MLQRRVLVLGDRQRLRRALERRSEIRVLGRELLVASSGLRLLADAPFELAYLRGRGGEVGGERLRSLLQLGRVRARRAKLLALALQPCLRVRQSQRSR